ncbi:MAG: restriction endonuclease subunit S [Azospirillaceae bacterium]|nr:restriction endonuclease subunit S [Azospirillaceae bacterium]
MSREIPKGWFNGCLEDVVATISPGVSVNSEGREKVAGEIGIIKKSCVTTGVFRPNEHKVVISTEIERVAESVERDSVIVSRMNTPDLVGASAYICHSYSDLFLPDRLWQVRPSKKATGRWLSFVIGSPAMRARLKAIASGTSNSMKNISQDSFLGLPVRVPPIDEQRRIAAVLETWDLAVEQTERLIAAESERQSLLLEHLFTGRQFGQTEGTRYQRLPLGEISNCYSGGTPDRGDVEYFGGGIPWVKSGEVVSSNIIATEETLSERGLTSSSAKWVPAGSTLVAMYGANAGQVGRLGVDATTNQAILAVVPCREIVTPEYLYHSIINTIPSLMRKVQGSGQPNLSAGIVKDEKILVPDVYDQIKISKVATALETSIQLLEATRAKLLNQKRGLMQKLLTGAWRLDERFDPEAKTPPTSKAGARS